MADLLKCPFCGYGYASVDRNSDGFVRVQCHKSGCMARTDGCLNEQEAIRLWNTRKPMEEMVAELEDAYYEFYSMEQHDKENPFNEGLLEGYKRTLEIVRGKE